MNDRLIDNLIEYLAGYLAGVYAAQHQVDVESAYLRVIKSPMYAQLTCKETKLYQDSPGYLYSLI